MALALAGLEALHSQGVSAGDLTADCLLLAPASQDAPKQRTVKILHAGVKRQLFDETAIGRSISLVQGIPEELELAASCTFQVSKAGTVDPAEDIFRLGCIFYRCVTGKIPFTARDLAQPLQPARPVAEVAPEVPEMLCLIIEKMIDPQPANRPQKAANVAKSLRVFLAAEEQGQETRAEENIVSPRAKMASRAEEEEAGYEEVEDEEEEQQEEEVKPRSRKLQGQDTAKEGVWEKGVALWEEVQPQVRDLLFLAGGALGMLALIFIVGILTGIQISYIAGLATGAVASYFVEMYLAWRKGKKQLGT